MASWRDQLRNLMTGPLTYRQRDLEAAMRAARKAGFPVREITIDRDGKIVIVTGLPVPTGRAPAEPTEWEKIRDKI